METTLREGEIVRIVFTGGGSGGHVYPLIAIAEVLGKKFDDIKVNVTFDYLGPNDAYAALLSGHGMSVHPIAAGKMRRYFSLENFFDIPKLFIGFFQALYHLYLIMPDVVFSKGGTGALPVVVAAWFYRIPVAIHDSDATPGKTNVMSGRFATKIFLSFDKAAAYFNPAKVEITGAPLRAEFFEERTTKEAAKEIMGFNKDQPLTLIMGGSQGAMRINDFVLANINQFLAGTQVLHQTGVANLADVQKLSQVALLQASPKNKYLPVGYFQKDIITALTAADVVVARSGSSVFELAAFGLPAILIPLSESANDHQRADAYEFAKTGAAVVIEESNLLPGIFFTQLNNILTNVDLRAKMSAASSAFFIPGAAETIAQSLITLVSK